MRERALPGKTAWPALPLAEWQATYDTLHMWSQIAGKIRLELSPRMNHWWEVSLYVDARGLTTSPIPYNSEIFSLRFDFLDHDLIIETSSDKTARIPLRSVPVAEFYGEVMSNLTSLGINVHINTKPMEVADPIRFEDDYTHRAYDPEYAQRFWKVLVASDTVFKEFRSFFQGKCSPVHFFWGSFDLAVTRFSGRRAPDRPGADLITREAYSHEVISAGFWPGGGGISGPAFYSYTVPEPAGLASARVLPGETFYHKGLGEFLLMYDDLRRAASPGETLLEFLQSTYEAGAGLARWDRESLERRRQ